MTDTVEFSTLVELVCRRAEARPNETAYVFLRDGQSDEQKLTYAELATKSKAIAESLKKLTSPGDTVLINHNPGLDYITAFFGSLFAGVIAVPVYPPRFNQKLGRLDSIVRESLPKVALTSNSILETLVPQFERHPLLKGLNWFVSDAVSGTGEGWENPGVESNTLAFLQYTSGSTSQPKGVMLTHGNLLANLAAIADAFETDRGGAAMSWLPPYHDMGLIGGILEPLYSDIPCVMMSPYTFLMRPFRWLQAITKYKITYSGAPNFAYDLCVRRINEKQMAELDLSSWDLAFCGAEPIRADVLDRFADKFASVGFKREALYPCYGLAEATLIVTGAERTKPHVLGEFDKAGLENRGIAEPVREGERGNWMVSCGRVVKDHEVAIVDPKSGEPLPEGQVGEVWVSGPSVAQGYWKNPEVSRQTFQARLPAGQKNFLRTGDLGFLKEGELFVTGRIKDLVIIRGRNFFPQDIERTVELSHPALKAGSGVAVAVDEGGEEQLVIIQEVERAARDLNLDHVIQCINDSIVEEYGIRPYAISLIKSNSIPLTTSGKVQRQASKQQFLQGELSALKTVTSGVMDPR